LLKEHGAVATEKKADAVAPGVELLNAIREGKVEVVRSLLANVDVNARMDGKDEDYPVNLEVGDTPLIAAVDSKQYDVIKMLLGIKNINVNKIRHGSSALQYAVLGEDPKSVKLLLDAGADVNLVPNPRSGSTALIRAANKESLETVKLLLAAGAKVDVVEKEGGRTALMRAILRYEADFEVVKSLLEAGASVKFVDYDGLNALDLAIEHNVSPQIVALLKEHGAVATGTKVRYSARTS